MMRVGLIYLIILSQLFLEPLGKNYSLFPETVICQKSRAEAVKACTNPTVNPGNMDSSQIQVKRIHRVRRGDSLSSIAEKYNVSVKDLMDWNHLTKQDRIYRGQKLFIKRFTEQNHILSPGQSISLYKPVAKWTIIKGYIPYGDNKNFGLLCKIEGGNSIRAANSGKVVKISHLRGYGKYILIDHGNGWHSLYSNINDVNVKSGQYVNFSETIGKAKDNKLFFLLAYNGKPVNPTGYFITAARDR